MKVGDLVTDDFYEDVGLVVGGQDYRKDCDLVRFGTMMGDVYEVVDVLCPDGTLRLFTTDEVRVISENRDSS